MTIKKKKSSLHSILVFGVREHVVSDICHCILSVNVSGLPGVRGVRVTSGGTLWTASVI